MTNVVAGPYGLPPQQAKEEGQVETCFKQGSGNRLLKGSQNHQRRKSGHGCALTWSVRQLSLRRRPSKVREIGEGRERSSARRQQI